MAEFREVIKQMMRMCAHFKPTCNGCPLCLEKGTNEFCGEQPLDMLSDPALVEAAVMRWAKEHPEPVYPTWAEWLESMHVITVTPIDGCMIKKVLPAFYMFSQIPADIAQKLGLEPKEGV